MSRVLDVLLFLLLSLLWGLTFLAIEVGLESLPPLLFAALRYDVAGAFLLAYVAVRLDGFWPSGRHNLVAIAAGGVFLVAGNGLLFVGQQSIPSGVAAIIQSLIPIFTAVWALVLLGERLSPLGVAGVAVGFLGIGFVVHPDPTDLLAGDTVGRLLVVGQVLSVALGGVLVQRAAPTIDRASLTGWAMVVGAVVLHVASLVAGESPGAVSPTPAAIGALLYLGLFATAIAYVVYFTILADHGAFQVALVAYLVPVVATVVGVVVLGESIGATTITGFALVAAGFATLKRRAVVDAVRATASVGAP